MSSMTSKSKNAAVDGPLAQPTPLLGFFNQTQRKGRMLQPKQDALKQAYGW